MTITAERLRVEVEAQVGDAIRDLDRVNDKGSRIPGWVGLAKGALAGLGGAAVVALGKQALDAASDLSETVSKTTAVFGDATDGVLDYAQETFDAFGLSKTALLDAASGFGLLGNAAGLATEASAGMSVEMAQLAADASSFYNVPLEEALGKIKSGLVGEAEPLRAFGVLLSQAAVEAKALELGIWDGSEAMTEGMKVQARAAIIAEGLATASGDLERTQAGVANQTRELAGRAQGLAADYAGLLLPAAAGVLQFMNGLLEKVPAAAETMDRLSAASAAVAEVLGGNFSGAVGEALGVEEDSPLVGVLLAVGDAAREAWDVVQQMGGAFMEAAGPAVGALVDSLVPLLPQLLAAVQAFSPLHYVMEALLPILPQLAGMLGQIVAALADTLAPILTMLVPLLAELSGAIIGALSEAFMAILPPVLSIVEALLPLVGVLGLLLAELLPPIVALFMALLDPILALIGPLVDALTPALDAVAAMVGDFLVPILTVLAGWLADLVGFIAPVVAAILGGLVTALTTLIRWVAQVVTGIATFVAETIAALGRWVTSVGDSVGDAIQWFRDMPGKVGDAIAGLWDMLYDAGANIVDGLVDGIKSAASKVTDAISGVMSAVRDFLPFSPAKRGPFSGSGWALYSGRSIPEALAQGLLERTGTVSAAAQAVVEAANVAVGGMTLGGTVTVASVARGGSGGASGVSPSALGSPGAPTGPSSLTIVDANGDLIGAMRVQAGKVLTGAVSPLDEGRVTWG